MEVMEKQIEQYLRRQVLAKRVVYEIRFRKGSAR